MKVTLDIDDDVLELAKSIAEIEEQSIGKVISDLLRQFLSKTTPNRVRNGVPTFKPIASEIPMSLDEIKALNYDDLNEKS